MCWCFQADLANKMISITGRGLESQMLSKSLHSCFSVMASEQCIPCLLIVWPSIGLKQCSQCFNNLSGIVILTYFCCEVSKEKPVVRQMVNQSSMLLQFTFPSTKTLLHGALAFNAPSSSYSTRICISFPYRTNRIVAGLLQLTEIITHTWSVSASCHSTLFEPKTL